MEPYKTCLERAFELARSGDCKTVDAIKQRLKHEGYNQETIDGPSLKRQLRGLMADASSNEA
jgi:hypothetical protein